MKFLTNILAKAGLIVDGSTTLNSLAGATIDTDKFLVSDGGVIKYRTGAEVLSDIGAQPVITNAITGTGTANYLAKFTGGGSIGNSIASESGTTITIAGTLSINTSGQARTISTYHGAGTTGWNIFIGGGGQSSGGSYDNGSYNTSIGGDALLYNTSGYRNSALGLSSLGFNTAGFRNTAAGSEALLRNTTGYRNVALGEQALSQNTSGYRNTSVGVEAGSYVGAGGNNQTSNNSVYIGYLAMAGVNGSTNEVVIGASATGGGSNTVTIGNSSITNTYLKGQANISLINNATSNTNAFLVSDGGTIKYRTGAQLLSDIGAQAAGSYVASSRSLTINGTSYDLSADRTWSVGTVTSVGVSVPTSLSVSNTPVTSSGTIAISLAAGYSIPTTASQANWDTAYANRITSLTTTGTSGAATLTSNTLNIPIYQAQGNYITSLTGEATASGPGAASVTLTNSAVIGKVLTGLNVTGGTIVATDSILTAFGKVQNQINGLMGGVVYQGTWNASTNSPTLTSSSGTKGYYYIVTTAGSTNLDGITDWKVGDWAIFNGSTWNKVDNTDAVVSVNGQTGAVSLTTSNISEGTNLYYTDARARAAISLTTTGSSGAATYVGGVLNVPQYTLGGLGGVPTSRQLTINGTAYDLSADRSWSVGTVTSVAATAGSGISISGSPITSSGTLTITNTGVLSINGSTGAVTGIITTSNYNSYSPTLTGGGASGTWGINITGSAGSAGVASYVNGTSGGAIQSWDVRTISPSSMSSYRLGFGFTSWNNNNGAPYADYLHLRSYSDSSGGSDNLITFLKSGFGMRIWQQSFGSASAYSSYVDVLHSGNYNSYAPTLTGGGASGTWGIAITGNAGTATTLQNARTINGTSFNGSANIVTSYWGTSRTLTIGSTGKSVDGSANVSWSLAEIGAQASGTYLTPTNTDFTYNASVTLSTSWQDTGVNNSNLSTSGVYMITCYVNDFAVSGGQYTVTYTGIMYWYASSTNGVDYSEIALHNMGHANNSRYIYLRTRTTSSAGGTFLQIRGNGGNSGASTYTFSFKRLM